jgi:hypothetical protein
VRALVVSTAHPNHPTVLAGWVRPLTELGWDVTYVAPFADRGVRPPAGMTGLDFPVNVGRRRTLRIAAGVLRYRGPEFDLVVVSAVDLADRGADLPVRPHVARPGGLGLACGAVLDRLVRRPGDGPAGSSATPSASGSAGAPLDRSAIPPRIRRTTPAVPRRAGTAAR